MIEIEIVSESQRSLQPRGCKNLPDAFTSLQIACIRAFALPQFALSTALI